MIDDPEALYSACPAFPEGLCTCHVIKDPAIGRFGSMLKYALEGILEVLRCHFASGRE